MQYTDHPDYPLYADIIKRILDSGYPLKDDLQPNHSLTPLPILEEKYFLPIHNENSHLIGQKRNQLTVLGFLKPESNASGQLRLACECACGSFCSSSAKSFKRHKENSFLSCSKCKIKIDSFALEFLRLTNKVPSDEVIKSILNFHDGSEIMNFIRVSYDSDQIDDKRKRKAEVIGSLSIEDLKNLLLPNSDLNQKFFKLSDDGNSLIKPPSTNPLFGCSKKASECLDLGAIPNLPANLKTAPSKKIFKLRVIGILANGKPLRTRNITYVCQCDCGWHSNISHENLKSDRLPACGHCDAVMKMTITAERLRGNIISHQEAWELLGENTKIVAAQIEDLKSIKTNAYNTPRKVYERETSFEKFQVLFDKRYGLVSTIAKSRRLRTENSYYQLACKCDCGNECVFPYDMLKYTKDPSFLACSSCASIIQSTLHMNITVQRTSKFNEHWKAYLTYHGVSTDLNFIDVFNQYLKLKQQDPTVTFKQKIHELIRL